MTNVSKAMKYAATFERDAMREKLDAAIEQSDYALNMEFNRREWVGLTGAEINRIFAANVGYPERMMKDVENLLKEKNT
jgi:hypothetical protein